MVLKTDEEDGGGVDASSPQPADDHADKTRRTEVAGALVMLAAVVSLLAAAGSMMLWFYGAWSAGVEIGALAVCALTFVLAAVSARLWIAGEL